MSHVEDLEQHKDFSKTLIFEAVIRPKQFLVDGGVEIHYEELICEETNEIIELNNFQIDNLSIDERVISNNEVLMKCHR